jgi:hypothetical protein
MAIGETSRIESTDKDKVETLVQKVKDLNSRLLDVRREQVFQRVRQVIPFFLFFFSTVVLLWNCPYIYIYMEIQTAANILLNRSAKPNSATSQNTQTRASSAGP